MQHFCITFSKSKLFNSSKSESCILFGTYGVNLKENILLSTIIFRKNIYNY
jgi:hypothetical protein